MIRAADPGGFFTFTAGGDAGLVEHISWDGTVLWQYTYFDAGVRNHHDISVLPNGNTLSLDGRGGKIFEVDDAGIRHWLYINPVVSTGPVSQFQTPVGNMMFRASRYPLTFPGFVGKDVTPKGTVEMPPVPGLMDVAKVGLIFLLVLIGIVGLKRIVRA